VRETGSEIWDCGHWQDGNRSVPGGDYAPGDPLGTAGAEPIGGEEIEIHPIAELATWRKDGSFVPRAATAPVRASQLDVAISNQGGKAKGVEECALLAPAQPTAVVNRVATGQGCSTLQDVTVRDYTYELTPPGPRPAGASLVFQQDDRYSHDAPAPIVGTNAAGDALEITVPFSTVARSTDVQDFGATWRAWWSTDSTPLHHFKVTVESVTINNNLDGDSGDTNANPSITPEGEWNMFVDRNGQWTNLHDTNTDPGRTDFVPELGAVPSAHPTPVTLTIDEPIPPTFSALPDDGTLHLFVDARECDQPRYVDCPTKNELAATGRSAGRADILLPVSQLAGKATTITIHPHVCDGTEPCGEEKNPPDLCGPTGCYNVTFRVEEVSPTLAPITQLIVGDGTATGTLVGGAPATGLSWWLAPATRYAVDQGEENKVIKRVLELMR
jgi:hypothetical protein